MTHKVGNVIYLIDKAKKEKAQHHILSTTKISNISTTYIPIQIDLLRKLQFSKKVPNT